MQPKRGKPTGLAQPYHPFFEEGNRQRPVHPKTQEEEFRALFKSVQRERLTQMLLCLTLPGYIEA